MVFSWYIHISVMKMPITFIGYDSFMGTCTSIIKYFTDIFMGQNLWHNHDNITIKT